MKKTITTCDVTGETVDTPEAYQEKFIQNNFDGMEIKPVGKILGDVKCNIAINKKTFNIEIILSSEDVEDMTKKAFNQIMSNILNPNLINPEANIVEKDLRQRDEAVEEV